MKETASRNWFDLAGQVALITGGSRGLGKAIAEALAGAGASVCLASRNLGQAQATAEELAATAHVRTMAAAADVSQVADVERLVADTLAELGPIDVLVNCAGAGLTGRSTDFSDEAWGTVIETNLSGAFYCCRAAGRHMVGRKYGRILNVASILGSVALPGFAAYAASKAGLIGLTKALALEWAGHGVTVNALCPGFFLTEMTAGIDANPDLRADVTRRIPIGRWGLEHEVGAAALYLASREASFTTGTCLFLDGGWTAQ
jgi:NAD(P)-dependent dehydrogenase (short-subunit alcohol dehydrogenase family)